MIPKTVVKSLAGRDSGEWFAVISLDNDFALIANGKSRPLSRPKRKRIKHLAASAVLLADECFATDRALRSALRILIKEGNDLGKG